MKKLSALTMSLLLSLGVVAANANDNDATRGDTTRGNQDASYSMVDKNGDGNISREEAREAGINSERFDELDRDGDGQLSQTEFRGQGDRGGNNNWR